MSERFEVVRIGRKGSPDRGRGLIEVSIQYPDTGQDVQRRSILRIRLQCALRQLLASLEIVRREREADQRRRVSRIALEGLLIRSPRIRVVVLRPKQFSPLVEGLDAGWIEFVGKPIRLVGIPEPSKVYSGTRGRTEIDHRTCRTTHEWLERSR